MGSGNSGSLESSSGGDEEYDDSSRGGNAVFIPPHLPPSPIFDAYSTYSQNPTLNAIRNMPSSWQRSDPDSTVHQHHPLLTSTSGGLIAGTTFQQAAVGSESSCPAVVATALRNPKKRSRASRRAPTTVLTTDTANFRTMVQEFTGIPAPQFGSSSASFQRTTAGARLDHLFLGTKSMDPSFLRQPITQKVQFPTPVFLSTSSSSPLLTSTGVANSPHQSSTSNSASASKPPINYQLPIHQNSNLFNSQIPFLETNSRFLLPTSKHPNIYPASSFGFPSADQPDDGSGSLLGLQHLISSNQNAVDWRSNGFTQDENIGFQTSPFSGMIQPTSSLHTKKAPENVAAVPGDGNLDSWIFSSD